MFGVILKATNSSFQKCMTFCRSIHVKKVMKLLAFIFEQPSYFKAKNHAFTWGKIRAGIKNDCKNFFLRLVILKALRRFIVTT